MVKKASNTTQVKKNNIEKVLRAIKKMDGATKQEMARETGLSVATCGTILNELVDSGEVIEGEYESAKGGRPARTYRFNENFSLIVVMVLIVEKKSTNFEYAVCNGLGETIESFSARYTSITVKDIVKRLDELMAKYENIHAVGISVPGILQDGIITNCDEKQLINKDIAKAIKKKYEVEVVVEAMQRVNVLGYYLSKKSLEGKTVATIVAPEQQCLVSGIISNGRIISGDNFMAGEVSYMFRSDEDRTVKDEIIEIVLALISIVNPTEIVLVGRKLEDKLNVLVRDECKKYVPEKFIPEITLIDDPQKYMEIGLLNVTQKLLEQ